MSAEKKKKAAGELSLEHQVIHNMMAVGRTHRKMVESSFSNTGLQGSQHRLLMHLGKRGNVSQTELAKGLEVTPATVAVALKKLEKDGYLSKLMNEEDNRYNRIEITEKGERIIKESRDTFRRIDGKLLAGFTPEELEQLNGFFLRMKENGGNTD